MGTVFISCLSVVVALCAFLWQVRRARFNQSVDLLFRLENDFFGPAKKLQRVRAAHDLQGGRILEAEPILDFFETMALLLRRGALDAEIVRHTFFYWMDHYYEATRQIIAERQNSNPLVWKDLSALIPKLREQQQRQSPPYKPPTAEQITKFLNEELTEAG